MTREEQKAYNAENYPASVFTWLNEATDRAYDNFESRSCDTCLEGHNLPSRGVICHNGVRQYQDKNNDIDFYCNKWEQK